MNIRPLLVSTLILTTGLCAAQKPRRAQDRSGYEQADRATVLHVANVYVMAESTGEPIATVTPGHEVVVLQRNGPWISVLANTDSKDDGDPDSQPEFTDPQSNPDPSSGWIRDKGVVGPRTPHGDAILYGVAAGFEAQAEAPHSPKGAANAAHLLYRRVGDYFPDSPLAGDAAFHSADIRWQLDKLDISTLPSAKEQEAYLRPRLFDGELKRVMKMYRGTEWEARAAFDLIDDKLCGDWQGLPKCPLMEADLYVGYADRYKGGPKSAEALYDATYRTGAAVTMYLANDNAKQAAVYVKNTQALADRVMAEYPNTVWAARSAAVAYKVNQRIPVFGDDRD